jgi:hypothetical protein
MSHQHAFEEFTERFKSWIKYSYIYSIKVHEMSFVFIGSVN